MFSGKTEELIRRLNRVKIANRTAEIFKPALDTRYHAVNVISHNTTEIVSTPVENSQTILLLAGATDVVGIDEAQFFDEGIVEVCETLANKGTRVIVAGLDKDFAGKPFGPVPQLLAIADYITKLHAICVICGSIASYSYRTTAQQKQILLGEKNVYEPRCRKCYYDL